MKSKRYIFLALVIVMLISMLSINIKVSASKFSDVGGHWAEEAITEWNSYSVIQGSNGIFNPNENITRAQLAIILNKIMGYQVKVKNSFKDLSDSWYTDAMLKANAAGVILGDGANLRPTDTVTRQEAVSMIGRAFNIKEIKGETGFEDNKEISTWAKGYV